jgi:hypothetical protein
MKYLILFFVSFSLFAGNFAKISEIESRSISGVFNDPKRCGSGCVDISKCSNINYCEVVDEMVDDYDSPNFTTISVESCLDEDDCDQKFLDKTCDFDNGFYSVKDIQRLEVSCRRLDSYNQVLSGKKIIKENPTLKASYMAAEKVKNDAKRAEKDSIISLRLKLESGKTLTPVELSSVLKFLLKAL